MNNSILSSKTIAVLACLTPLHTLLISPAGFTQELPPSIDPGRIDQELRTPSPSELPDRIEVPNILDAIVPPGAEDQRFVSQEVRGVMVNAARAPNFLAKPVRNSVRLGTLGLSHKMLISGATVILPTTFGHLLNSSFESDIPNPYLKGVTEI